MERRTLNAPTFAVRPGRRDDLDAIETIETTVFASDLLSRRALRRALSAPSTETRVATLDGESLAGYAMIAFRRTSRTGRVFSIAVVPRAARRGVGAALLAGCEAAAWQRGCDRVRLEVRDDNGAAIALYDRMGYTRFGHLEDYYEDGATALRFEKAKA